MFITLANLDKAQQPRCGRPDENFVNGGGGM